MRRHVITGAPGTGKTALIASLAGLGTTVGEPARELISEHRAATGEPSLDHAPEMFVRLLVERSIEKFDNAPGTGIVIYDRGLPDCVAYARELGVSPDRAVAAARTRRYADPVVVAPPWEDIYTTDDMRRATFDQVVAFHTSILTAYDELGYQVVELPRSSLETRAVLVMDLFNLSPRSGTGDSHLHH